MRLTYDPQKRADTLEHRGLDFDDAVEVFDGHTSASKTTAIATASFDGRASGASAPGW
jgi:uncharacterized DUF497 family protein